MPNTLNYTSELVVVECWCGMPHAVPSSLRDFQLRQHRDGKPITSIYCPLGHSHHPAGDGEAAKLRKRLIEQERIEASLRDDLRVERGKVKAAKAAATKAAKRSSNGVCPHPDCKRSFVDVARHVRTKHPELVTK